MIMIFGESKARASVVDKYLEWKGADDAGYFSTYNKDTQQEEKYNFKDFVLLKKGYKVKGFTRTKAPIYSNEIEKFDESFRVQSNGQVIIKGKYSDIKEELRDMGGKLHLSITGLIGTEVVNFTLKGLTFYNFNQLLNEVNINTNKIMLEGYEDGQNGAVKFRLPIFKEGKAISEEEISTAKNVVDTIISNKKILESMNQEMEYNSTENNNKEEEIDIENIPF